MDDLWYQMIFKRKSFHIFKDRQTISDIELRNIEENIKNFEMCQKYDCDYILIDDEYVIEI